MINDQLSMLEVAQELMKQKKTPQAIMTIIKEVLELKGLDDPNGDYATQLYTDITTSSDYVYVGDNKWDLKSRQSLELFDRDGSYFNTGEDVEEDDEVKLDDYNIDDEDDDSHDYDDEDEENDENSEDYEEYEENEDNSDEEEHDPNEDDDENDYLDEEEYNNLMDDYEDMYEDN